MDFTKNFMLFELIFFNFKTDDYLNFCTDFYTIFRFTNEGLRCNINHLKKIALLLFEWVRHESTETLKQYIV